MGQLSTHRKRRATIRGHTSILSTGVLPTPLKAAGKSDVSDSPVEVELVAGGDVTIGTLLREAVNDFFDAQHADADRCRQIVTRARVVSQGIIPLLLQRERLGGDMRISRTDRLLQERCRICALPNVKDWDASIRSGTSVPTLVQELSTSYPEEEVDIWARSLSIHMRKRHYEKPGQSSNG